MVSIARIERSGEMAESYLSEFALRMGPVLCVCLAAFLQSITGFGLVMTAAPLLLFFYDAKIVIITMFFLASCGNALQTAMLWRQVNWCRIWELACGAVVGIPLGFLVFRQLPSDGLKLIVSIVILFSLITMQMKHKRFEENRRNTIFVGILAGIMAMTTGMAGPPLAIYFACTSMPQPVFRATCICYFLFSNFCSLMAFWIGGISVQAAMTEFTFLLPGLLLGIGAGHMAFRFMPTKLVRRMIFMLLYFTCIYNIYVSIIKL